MKLFKCFLSELIYQRHPQANKSIKLVIQDFENFSDHLFLQELSDYQFFDFCDQVFSEFMINLFLWDRRQALAFELVTTNYEHKFYELH